MAEDEQQPGGDITPGSRPAPRIVQLLQANGRAAWYLVGVMLAIGLLLFVFSRLRLVLFAIFVAVVHAAIISPVAAWFERRGLGRRPATAAGLLVVVLSLGSATAVVAYRLVDQLPEVIEDFQAQRSTMRGLLARPPLSMTEAEIEELLDRGVDEVTKSTNGAGDGATEGEDGGTGTTGDDAGSGEAPSDDEGSADDGEGPSPATVLALLQGSATALRLLGFAVVGIVLAFFLVRDRDRITRGTIRHLAGDEHGDRAYDVLRRAWLALDGYVRASVVVGGVEAVLIGTTLLIVGTPLAGTLTAITFVAAFVPVVGATVAGLLSVAMTWVGVGPVPAVIVAVVVLVVQQVDSHVLQPTVMANHTRLHPIATILALLVGGLVGGVLGALLAVPTAAVLVAVAGELLTPDEPPEGSTT